MGLRISNPSPVPRENQEDAYRRIRYPTAGSPSTATQSEIRLWTARPQFHDEDQR